MLFNSYTFVVFLAVVLIVYYALSSWNLRKFFLLIASYLFYAAWNPPFVVLLWISTIADWFLAKAIHNNPDNPARRKLFLAGTLLVNLGLLGFFKYGNFALDNFTALLGLLGVAYVRPELNIILPAGISFYTFQTLSYTIDVYRKRAKPSDSFLDYALYVTFFPQLVAGPIVRSRTFLKQCKEAKIFSAYNLGWGLCLIIFGLFLKIVIADGLCANITDIVFDPETKPDFISSWVGMAAFTIQFFCDFAGYSTCAIGSALCLGFYLPENFRYPYAAVGFADFWRRWHISLSTWLRDYIFVPLAMELKNWKNRAAIASLVTMTICGFWHGASWNFVIWGAIHGIFLVIEKIMTDNTKQWRWKKYPFVQWSLSIVTYLLFCFSGLFFVNTDFSKAWTMLQTALGFQQEALTPLVNREEQFIIFGVTATMLACHWIFRNQKIEQMAKQIPWWVFSAIIGFMLYAIFTTPVEDQAFLYFQF